MPVVQPRNRSRAQTRTREYCQRSVVSVPTLAKLRVLEVEEIKSVPYAPSSHAYASHCTSFERIGVITGNRRGSESLSPWDLIGTPARS